MAEYSYEEKIRLMHIVNLMSIAYADGEITDDENEILVRIAQEMGLSEEDFDVCVQHWKSTAEEDLPIAIPQSDEDQIRYLKHFTLLMMADGSIDDKEKEYLAYVADTYGYDPERVIPVLIDDVYEEYFAHQEEEEEDDDDEEEDPLFEDTDDESQLEMGKMDLEDRKVEDAFDELFLPALRNEEAMAYFLIIPNTATRLFRLSAEQMELVQEAAAKGYPLALYVLGRYHQVVKPAEDSIEQAGQLLQQAAEGGIPDARWALTQLYLYGYMGEIDEDEYNAMLEKAFDEGSMQAFKQRLHNMIQGAYGKKRDPKSAIKIIESFLSKNEEYAAMYPDMYALLGDAYRKVGNKDKADKCYEQARDLGFFEVGARRFENRVEGPDQDFYRQTLAVLLDFSCDEKDPDSFLARALESAWHYEQEGGDQWTEKMLEDLQAAVELGCGDAAYYLGQFYNDGSYGLEEDEEEAEKWFQVAQEMDSALAREGDEEEEDDDAEIPAVFIVKPDGKATIYKLAKEDWYKLAHLVGARRIAPVRLDALDKVAAKAGLGEHLVAWVDNDAPRKGLPVNKVASAFYPGILAGDVVFSLADHLYDPMPFYGVDEAQAVAEALEAEVVGIVTNLDDVSGEKPGTADYSKVNPYVNKGFVARIEPDGKAYIVENALAVFALVEEDIYDPVRLDKLYAIGEKLGLKGRLTLWTENSALRKQLVMNDSITPNPVAAQFCPGPVADNIFVAMEDEAYRILLFEDPAQLKQVCAALGVAPGNISC